MPPYICVQVPAATPCQTGGRQCLKTPAAFNVKPQEGIMTVKCGADLLQGQADNPGALNGVDQLAFTQRFLYDVTKVFKEL